MAENRIKTNIADNIAALRATSGLTQAQLADKLNYTDKAISKWERAESVPDIVMLKQIADMFGVTVDWLLEEHGNAPVPQNEAVRHALSHNKMQIALLSSVGVWFCATLSFVVLMSCQVPRAWLAFLWGIVATWIDLIVFSAIWAKKKWKFVFISLLIWSATATAYITIQNWGFWYIFLFAVPLQAATVFWGQIISIGKTFSLRK